MTGFIPTDTSPSRPELFPEETFRGLLEELFPICRTQCGEGVRDTLRILQRFIPLQVHEVPTGTSVFDWTVPPEWNVRDAWVATPMRGRVISFRECNLHVVFGSVPVSGSMTWDELRPHLHMDAHRPESIPYRTVYGRQTWGFCLTQSQYEQLESEKDQRFDVEINAEYRSGSLTYGEAFLAGSSSQECLLHTHTCHPSLANDNLSGLLVQTALYTLLSREPRRYSYRFLFAPATIGAITWLARNQPLWDRIHHGLILTCLGDRGPLTYKLSRSGSAPTDRVARYWNAVDSPTVNLRPFEPFGYDERQFCSPGINLPVGRLTRTPNGEFPEYHTSDDNLSLLHLPSLQDSLASVLQMLEAIEADTAWRNTRPCCEPRLDRYDLYGAHASGHVDVPLQRAVQWVLNLSCGQHTLLDIAERSRLPIPLIIKAACLLSDHGLLLPAQCTDETIRNNPQSSEKFPHLSANPTRREGDLQPTFSTTMQTLFSAAVP